MDRSGRGRSGDLQPALAGLAHEAEYLFQFWQFPISADLETLIVLNYTLISSFDAVINPSASLFQDMF